MSRLPADVSKQKGDLMNQAGQKQKAARLLTKEGFKDLVLLDKGFYEGWLKADLPVVK